MKINLRYLATYLIMGITMLYLVFLVNQISPDEWFPISLNVFGLVMALITLVFYQHRQAVFNLLDNESSSLSVEAKQDGIFIYAMGITGVLFILSIFIYFFVPFVYQSLPQIISDINIFYLFLSALLLLLFYYFIGIISSSLRLVRYLQIFLSGLTGLLVGNTLSYSAALFVSLLLSLGSKVGLLDTLRFIFLLSAYFGVGIAGIPSGVIGLISGFSVGTIMYRGQENISDDKVVTIGFIVSLTITVLVFFTILSVSDVSVMELLFTFLILGTVYILGSCGVSVLVYRKYFRVVSASLEEL